MKNKILLHIGYHKTGTSFLQKNIFEKFPKIFNRVPQRMVFDHFIYPNPFNYSEERSSQFSKAWIDKKKSDKTITVFSNE